MRVRSSLLILLGATLVLGVFELGLRTVEERMPKLSDWPTTETELKNTQLVGLAEAPSILFVGSSVTESGVDPAQLLLIDEELRAYNAAFTFYSPAALDVWLTEITMPWAGLDYLIMGLPPWTPPADPSDDPLAIALGRTLETTPTESPVLSFALWRLRGALADLDEAASRDRASAGNLWTDLGHQTYYYGRSGEAVTDRFSQDGLPAMSQYQEQAVRHIIEVARAAGVTPVLLVEPGRHLNGQDDEAIEKYIVWLEALSKDLGTVFWDTYSIDWDESLFADGVHFNGRGAAEYTRHLGNLIIELRDD